MIQASELIQMCQEHLGVCVPAVYDDLMKLCPISEGEYGAARARATTWRTLVEQLQSIRGGGRSSKPDCMWKTQARILHERSTEYERERACQLANVPRWERQTQQNELADYFAALHDLHRDAGKLSPSKIAPRDERQHEAGLQHLHMILAGLGNKMRVK